QGHNLIGAKDNFTNVVGTDLYGSAATPLDPKLGQLLNNGGPTLTCALLSGSPAIDAGDDSVTANISTDQRGGGFARKLGAHVDIGAFEYIMMSAISTSSSPPAGGTPRG